MLKEATKNFKSKIDPIFHNLFYSGIIGFFMKWGHHNLEKYNFEIDHSNVLEVGPGSEPHFRYIKKEVTNYYSVEVSDFAINELKKLGIENIVKYDGKKLPFENNFFDRIIISHVLEHINYPEEFIFEMMSKLKKGGILSISLPTDPGFLWRISRSIFKLLKFKKTINITSIEYDYINALEHVNSIYNLRAIIQYHYKKNSQETYVPFKIKIANLNLFYNVHIKKI